MRPVTSWGRLTASPHDLVELHDPIQVPAQIAGQSRPGIAQGMGRSYGDVCLNPDGLLWRTTGMDHFLAFDDRSGRLRCEAGVLLRDIQQLAIPRGWILPVTPGTQWVTVGGAIANDVHGKNHHRQGTFGEHVLSLRLVRTNGEIIDCGPGLRPEWFAATVGGLGLTGVMVEAEIQLQPTSGPWLETETLPFEQLDDFFRLADESIAAWEHTVSWIDCHRNGGGRGLFLRGTPSTFNERAEPRRPRLKFPGTPPFSLVNRLTLPLFNQAYFHLKRWQSGRALTHYEPFFYPLDNLQDWNLMYGPRGFFQYQSVVPRATGQDAVQAMLDAITRVGAGSFLAVLKTFGDRPAPGLLSFPQPGVTLALDFPNDGESTLRLFDRLDAIVREAGGRVYPAKDARMPRDLFEAGYPRHSEFIAFRDPGISSGLSRRLLGS